MQKRMLICLRRCYYTRQFFGHLTTRVPQGNIPCSKLALAIFFGCPQSVQEMEVNSTFGNVSRIAATIFSNSADCTTNLQLCCNVKWQQLVKCSAMHRDHRKRDNKVARRIAQCNLCPNKIVRQVAKAV